MNFDATKTCGERPWDQDLESKAEFEVDNDDDYNIHSSAWCVSDQGLAPFEYTYRGHGREIMPESLHMQLFFLDLSVKLQKLDLADVFGVCVLQGDFTGEAVPMGNHAMAETEPHPDGDHSIIVGLVWQFSASPKDGAVTWIRGPPYESKSTSPLPPQSNHKMSSYINSFLTLTHSTPFSPIFLYFFFNSRQIQKGGLEPLFTVNVNSGARFSPPKKPSAFSHLTVTES